MTEFGIRKADPRDAPNLVDLARAVSAEPGGWLLSEDGWRSIGEERRYLRAVRRHPDAVVLVAEDSEGIVGRLSLARDAHPASRHVADIGLMVAASHRRRGIGLALLGAAEEWARWAEIRKLELHVFPHNEPAIRLYEKAGYVREGYRHDHYVRGGKYVDAILMAKTIEAESGRSASG